MIQKAYNPHPEGESQKPIGCKQGCLMLLIPLVVIYFAHAVFLFVPNSINQAKWRIRGSENYKFIVSKAGFLPPEFSIGRNVVVKDGEIIFASNVSLNEPVYSWDIETIQEMLNGVYFCSLLFPIINCSYKYDEFYGYPSEVTVNCPIPDACYTKVFVRDFEIVSP